MRSKSPAAAARPSATHPAAATRKPRLFELLARAKQNLFRSADAVFAGSLGYSGTQVVALFAIGSAEGCQLKDLGRMLQLKNAAITGLVARMDDNGLVRREACTQDGRASRLRLTPRGREVLARARPVLDGLNADLTHGFTAAELAVVVRFLEHARDLRFSSGVGDAGATDPGEPR